MAPHSSTLAWKIPWREEPGRLQSMGSLRVGHDWVTSLSLFTVMHWRRKWQPTPVFLPGESQGRGAWWAAVYGVAQSQTRLKRLSSSSSKTIFNPGVYWFTVYKIQFLCRWVPMLFICHHCDVRASLVAQTVRIHNLCRRPGFNPWVGKIPWRREWQSTPVFLPGKSPRTEEEPGGLQSMGSQKNQTWLSLSLWCHMKT